jgi:hypothetical protein
MTAEFHKRYYIDKKLAKDLTKLASCMYDPNDPAKEINNPKPLFEALGLKKPMSMQEKIERLFRGPRGLIEQMYEQGEERPEEMFDFGPDDDDIEPLTPYEYAVMRADYEAQNSASKEPEKEKPIDQPKREKNVVKKDEEGTDAD